MGKLSSGTNVGVSRRSGALDFMCLDNETGERGGKITCFPAAIRGALLKHLMLRMP